MAASTQMIVAIGIDIIEISRIEEALVRRGHRFRDRVFTESEIEYCDAQASGPSSYAARFAAKEATMKALGAGWFDGIRWRDIEVRRNQAGRPSIELGGRALERFKESGAKKIHLSLSHSRDLALAQVVLEG